jgi:hypothetical protein
MLTIESQLRGTPVISFFDVTEATTSTTVVENTAHVIDIVYKTRVWEKMVGRASSALAMGASGESTRVV